MTIYYEGFGVILHHGDCVEVMRELPDSSVDAVVTDPPYGLEFMGKEWDAPWKHGFSTTGYTDGGQRAPRPNHGSARNPVCRTCRKHQRGSDRCQCLSPAYDERPADSNAAFGEWTRRWATECLRVLKPGGHLLAFGGTRTWHRMVCGIEDAGFEIRDCLAYMFGSGFPKSLDVSKAIDKRRDWKSLPLLQAKVREARKTLGISQSEAARRIGLIGPDESLGGGGFMWFETGMRVPTREQYPRLKAALNLDDECDRAFEEAEREVLSERITEVKGGSWAAEVNSGRFRLGEKVIQETAPATPDAERWQGWGTALKPAFEPVVVARKPLAGTVAATVLAHGTGALNIDACRIAGTSPSVDRRKSAARSGVTPRGGAIMDDRTTPERYMEQRPGEALGRWPANVVLDETAAAMLDEQTGDSGGASRYFYTAKADQSERPRVDGVAHPTVKPLDLMRWLVRLVTPPGGTVLDLFAGSGPTAEACIAERFDCIAIEREADYLPLIRARIARQLDAVEYVRIVGDPLPTLFDDLGDGAAS